MLSGSALTLLENPLITLICVNPPTLRGQLCNSLGLQTPRVRLRQQLLEGKNEDTSSVILAHIPKHVRVPLAM